MNNSISSKPKAAHAELYETVAQGLGPVGRRTPEGDILQSAPPSASRLLAARAGKSTANLIPQPKAVPFHPTVPAFTRAPSGSVPPMLKMSFVQPTGPVTVPTRVPPQDDDAIMAATPLQETAPAAAGVHVHFAEVLPTPGQAGGQTPLPDYPEEVTPEGWSVSAQEIVPTPSSELSAAPAVSSEKEGFSQRLRELKDEIKVAVRGATAKPRARMGMFAGFLRKQR